jgi:hypothetical protein
MAKISIPCLVRKANKSGIANWYWQPSKTLRDAGFQPEALGKDEGRALDRARKLNEKVAAWKLGGEIPKIRNKRGIGSFSSLIERYRREILNGTRPDGKPRISRKTAETYETSLKRLELWAGKHPVAMITPARVRNLRDTAAKPKENGGIGHSSAFSMLKTLRQVMKFAESIDVIPKGSNPATDFGLGPPTPRRTVWEAEDEAAFIAAAYELGLPSMALAVELAIYSAQREGDLIAMTEGQLVTLELFDPVLQDRLAGDDGTVLGWRMTQHKTGVDLEIPIEQSIRSKLEKALRHNRARDRAKNPPITIPIIAPGSVSIKTRLSQCLR